MRGWKKCIWMTLHMHTMTWSLGMSYWLFNLTNLQRQWSWTLVALHQLINKLGLAQRPSHCRYSTLTCWLLMLVNPRAWSPTSVDLLTLLQNTIGKFRFCRYFICWRCSYGKLVCGSKVLTTMSSDHRSGQRSIVLHHTGHQSFGIVQASVILMNAQMFGHWDALSLR